MEMKSVAALDPEHCTGCGVCANVCGKITMRPDGKGFLYPQVGGGCSNCGGCRRRCPVLGNPFPHSGEPEVYAAWSLDSDTRYSSTSGGIFTELAASVLKQDGFAAGAKYNSSHLVEHGLIGRIGDIPLLRQSKYVQSDTRDIFNRARAVLQTGKALLFCGTPCQCAGLYNFLGDIPDNLYLCDFICRGVNSPIVYLKYLRELEEQAGSRIAQVWFKNKTYGWNRFGTKIIFADGQEYFGSRDDDPFMYGYIKKNLNLYMRPSCGHCKFKGLSRPTDITLGDFWGVKLLDSSYDMRAGVSVVIIRTVKGQKLFGSIKPYIHSEEHKVNEVLTSNACLFESAAAEPDKRVRFWEEFHMTGFKKAMSYFITSRGKQA
jgi:coenzyme F420-reducing hydrogenase beta subunit